MLVWMDGGWMDVWGAEQDVVEFSRTSPRNTTHILI